MRVLSRALCLTSFLVMSVGCRSEPPPPPEPEPTPLGTMPAQPDGSPDCTGCQADCVGAAASCCNLDLSGACSDSPTEVGECILPRACAASCCAQTQP